MGSKRLQTLTIILTITSLSTLLMAFVVYQFVAQTIQQELTKAYNVSLLHTKYRVESFFRQLDQAVIQIESVPEVKNFSQQDKLDNIDVLTLITIMRRIHSSLDYIDNVYIYNLLNEDKFATNNTMNHVYSDYQAVISKFSEMNIDSAFINMEINGIPTSVFVRKLPVFQQTRGAYIIFHINRHIFDDFLGEQRDNNIGNYFIINEIGEMIVNRGSYNEASIELLVSQIKQRKQNMQEDEIIFFPSNKYFVMHLAPSYNDWIYAFAISDDDYLYQLNKLRNAIMIMCIVMLIISVLLSVISSHWLWKGWSRIKYLLEEHQNDSLISHSHNEFDNLFRKVQHVVDHSKHLKKQMNDMLPTMKDTLILSLLENGVRTMDDRKKIEEYSINLNEGAYCCFCVCIDSPKDMESTYTSKDIVTFEYAVATLAKEVIGQKGHAVIAHNGWCAAVLTDKGTTPDALNQIVIQVTSTIHQFINEYFPITVSIGISKVRTAPSHLNISYLEAQEMINNKLIAGDNQIFAAEDSPEKSALDPFPIREMENDILYGIRSRDRLFAIESVEQLYSLKGNRSISYKWLQSKLVETVQSIYRIMQKQVEPLSDLNEPTIDELLELASLDEWVDWFKSYCIDPLVDHLDKQHQLRITSTITNIQEHIQSHLETDLQLETCCRSLQISASFAKQALKESLDVTFSELVLKLRIEQAKQWLEEGELNINDIATRLQYSNSQNFSRTFKKVEGIPPGQYRSEFLLHLDT